MIETMVRALALLSAFGACAVTETGTPGADPSVSVSPAGLESMQLPDDPVSPFVAVEVRIPAHKLADVQNVSWTHVVTAEVTEASLDENAYVAMLTFVPEEPAFRLSAWSTDLGSIQIADLEFDFANQAWRERQAPCVRWSNRALEVGGTSERVLVINDCEGEREARYQRVVGAVSEAQSAQLEPGQSTLVEIPTNQQQPREVWQLEPDGDLLDVFVDE